MAAEEEAERAAGQREAAAAAAEMERAEETREVAVAEAMAGGALKARTRRTYHPRARAEASRGE